MSVSQNGIKSIEANWHSGVDGFIYYQRLGTNTILNQTVNSTHTMTQLTGLMEEATYSLYIATSSVLKAAAIIFIGIKNIQNHEVSVIFCFTLTSCDMVIENKLAVPIQLEESQTCGPTLLYCRDYKRDML